MPFTVNRLMIAGNLVRDPEVKQLAADRTVASFAVAINNRYRGPDGEQKSDTVFMTCEAWGKTAELIGQYLVKGSLAYCEGRLKQDSWTDNDGKNRTVIKMVVERVQFLGTRPAGDAGDTGEDANHEGVMVASTPSTMSAPQSMTTAAPIAAARSARPSRPVRQPSAHAAGDMAEDPPF